MTDLRKAAEMALEALEDIHPGNMTPMAEEYWGKAITALRQAIDHVPDTTKMIEPDMGIDRGAWGDVPDATKWVDELRGGDETEQEPVAWLEYDEEGYLFLSGKRKGAFPLFTDPPSKPWVSLTDEEIWEWFESNTAITRDGAFRIVRAIEVKLREKNT